MAARGRRFPEQRLHFNPIPTDVPRSAWIRTTVAAAAPRRRLEEQLEQRLSKYREADPDRRWPTDFGAAGARALGGDLPWPGGPGLPAPPVAVLERRGPGGRGGRRSSACSPPATPRPTYRAGSSRPAGSRTPWWRSTTGARIAPASYSPPSRSCRCCSRTPAGTVQSWDDAENRQRLLDAAAELEPGWIVSLDADERIDAADAAALRDFVQTGARPDMAYGFRVFRMVGDLDRYDQAGLWAYRLFAYAPGQRFPQDRLHFVPVPTAIDRRRFLNTTLRIQHLGGLTEEHREARFAKYAEADPGNEFQADYTNLLSAAHGSNRWEPRPDGLPVVPERAPLDLDGPVLSAIVISRNDEDRIERVVRAVAEQECPEPVEVIVVVSGTDRTAAIVRERFPAVTVIELDGRALPGRARNAGLHAARGEFVSFPGSHVELPPGSLAARIRAHQEGHALVTGTTLNGTHTRAGWASYFLDHSSVLPGRPSQRLTGPPAHCSYIRDHLLAVGGFPEDMRAGEDTVVNVELTRRGLVGYRAADVTIVHRSRCTNPLRLLRHHFQRGRGLGRIVLRDQRRGGRTVRRAIGLGYLRRRLRTLAGNVERWGDDALRAEYRRSRPLIAAGAAAAFAGAWFHVLRSGRAPGLAEPVAERPATRTAERFPTRIEVNAYVLPGPVAKDDAHAGEFATAAEALTLGDALLPPRPPGRLD